MVLADTSVWIDHYRNTNDKLVTMLESNRLVIHDLVIQELACGNLAARDQTIGYLSALPRVPSGSHQEVMSLIHLKKIHGTGLGSVDANLMISCLFAGADLFTLDKNLAQVWARCRP